MLANLHELGVAMQFPWYRTWVLAVGVACAIVGYLLPSGTITGRLRLGLSLGAVFMVISFIPVIHVFFRSSRSFSVTLFALRILALPTIFAWVAVLVTSGAFKSIITGLGRVNAAAPALPAKQD